MPDEKEPKKTSKKSDVEWEPDTSQILTFEETLRKIEKKEKKEK